MSQFFRYLDFVLKKMHYLCSNINKENMGVFHRQASVIIKWVFLPLYLLTVSGYLSASDSVPDRRKSDYFFLEALRLKQAERHSEAFNALNQSLAIDSTSAAALSELSAYYLAAGQDSLAADALQRAVRYSPDIVEYKIALADLQREFGNLEAATGLFEELAAAYPEKNEFIVSLSDLYLKQNQADKAIDALNALENNIGMNEAVAMQKFRLYLASEQKDRALAELDKLCTKYPNNIRYLVLAGDFHLDNDNPAKALELYNKARSIDASDPRCTIAMVDYYDHIGNREAAEEELLNALKNRDIDVKIQMLILNRYIHNLAPADKNSENIGRLFQTLMDEHSQERDLNRLYGQFLVEQGQLEEAKFQFRTIVESEPEDMVAWHNLLNIALRQDSTDAIVRICDHAIRLNPDQPEFYLHKSSALYLQDQLDAALQTVLEGATHIPDDQPALLSAFYGQAGDIYHKKGEDSEAFASYESALALNENNVMVLNNYAYFLSLENRDLDRAEQMAGRCVSAQPANSTYLDTYAWVFFRKGNYAKAKLYIENAISAGGGDNGEIIDHYGDILFHAGNINKAVEQWQKALVLKENNKETTPEEIQKLKHKISKMTYFE
jgi:tetratricopeptide (TPR) repeat protein